ncbi:MAG TPA: hypothetical protein VIK30_02900, partial [Polyangia bacterium]
MNRAILVRGACAVFLATVGCSQQGPTIVTGTGGTQGAGGTGTGTGGTSSAGGDVGSGGTTGSGSAGTDGAAGTDGTGTGGSTVTGTAGTNGGTAGSVGTAGSNGTAGRAGTAGTNGTAGTGGRAGTAGTSGNAGTNGNAGTTGKAGTTGAGGAGGAPTASSIVPTVNGYLWIGTCAAGTASALDCPIQGDNNATCPATYSTSTPYAQRGVFQTHSHTVGGTAGTQYTVNLDIRGITGGRCYNGGTIAAPTVIADFEGATGNNGWYSGGTPTDSKWNTYEIHVTPPVPGVTAFPSATDHTENVYYLNAFPATSAYCERHETFVMKYTASLPVLGGGTIKMVMHDANCLAQQNCGGIDSQSTCATPRSTSLA